MIQKFSLRYLLILVYRFKLFKQLWYQFWMTYSYLDRWSNLYQVVGIFTGHQIYNIWYENLVCNIHDTEIHICIEWTTVVSVLNNIFLIWTGNVAFNNVLVSVLDSILTKPDTIIIVAFSTNSISDLFQFHIRRPINSYGIVISNNFQCV
jgi:hypothetical protein